MPKIVAIHQPNFMPWVGFFHKMKCSHVFILMDNVQFSKETWINRVQIKTPHNTLWATIPVKKSGRLHQLISEVEIANERTWAKDLYKTFEWSYGKAAYWDEQKDFLHTTFMQKKWDRLIDLNIHVLNYLRQSLGFSTEIILLSKLGAIGSKSNLITDACLAVGGDIYLSGQQASDYNDEKIFAEKNIKLVYQKFNHPRYEQLNGEFVPGLSIFDMLLNIGQERTRAFFDANTETI